MRNRLRKARQDFGDMLTSDLEAFSKGGFQAGVSAPQWGTTLRLTELLEMFLVDGRHDVGKGDIVVPKDLDFVHEEKPPAEGIWRIKITAGNPYFEGKGWVKLIDTLSGIPTVKAIDVRNNCREGEIQIANFINYPFKLLRGE